MAQIKDIEVLIRDAEARKYRAREVKREYNSLWRSQNKPRIREYQRKYTTRTKASQEEKRLKRVYKIDEVQYQELLAKQNGRCGICGCFPEKRRLAVDHNHKSGRVRGLLCTPCNLCLSAIEKDISWGTRAVKYLLDTTNA